MVAPWYFTVTPGWVGRARMILCCAYMQSIVCAYVAALQDALWVAAAIITRHALVTYSVGRAGRRRETNSLTRDWHGLRVSGLFARGLPLF